MPDRHYVFGSEEVRIPDSGIAMIECGACGLIYKSTVPDPGFLAEVFERQASKKWLVPYDFSAEAAAVRRLMGRAAFDLLDVGAAGGGVASFREEDRVLLGPAEPLGHEIP